MAVWAPSREAACRRCHHHCHRDSDGPVPAAPRPRAKAPISLQQLRRKSAPGARTKTGLLSRTRIRCSARREWPSRGPIRIGIADECLTIRWDSLRGSRSAGLYTSRKVILRRIHAYDRVHTLYHQSNGHLSGTTPTPGSYNNRAMAKPCPRLRCQWIKAV